MRLTLRQLQIFVAVAHTGSTTAAAERVSLSQSATSAAINELERSLNTNLFDRVGKRLLLNESGRAMLPQALALLNGAGDLEQSFASGAPSMLHVGASLTIGNYLLPVLLAGFWRAQGVAFDNASLPMRVVVASTADIALQVEKFEVDVGLVEGACYRPGVQLIPWLEDELLIVASPSHPVVRDYGDGIVPMSRLAEVNWLMREPGSGTREIVEQLLLPQLRQMRSSLEFSDHEAIKRAAAEGLGVACLSRWVVSDVLESGKLVVVHSAMGSLKRKFHILLQERKQITPSLQNFIDFIRSHDWGSV